MFIKPQFFLNLIFYCLKLTTHTLCIPDIHPNHKYILPSFVPNIRWLKHNTYYFCVAFVNLQIYRHYEPNL